MSKKKAIGDLITCMAAMLVMYIILYLGVDICSRINIALQKENISRAYMLLMETEGYLSAENMAEMTRELNEIGVTDISFNGTTLAPAGYGNYIYLCVTGRVAVSGIMGLRAESWSFEKGEGTIDFRIECKSTAKY